MCVVSLNGFSLKPRVLLLTESQGVPQKSGMIIGWSVGTSCLRFLCTYFAPWGRVYLPPHQSNVSQREKNNRANNPLIANKANFPCSSVLSYPHTVLSATSVANVGKDIGRDRCIRRSWGNKEEQQEWATCPYFLYIEVIGNHPEKLDPTEHVTETASSVTG